jgi:Fis family transcriptional regulator, factor for inversion stimulation protein
MCYGLKALLRRLSSDSIHLAARFFISKETVMSNNSDLSQCVKDRLTQYFQDLDGAIPNNVYDMLISAVEKPLLEVIMGRTRGNQSKASVILGINRNTLRKKLLQHDML